LQRLSTDSIFAFLNESSYLMFDASSAALIQSILVSASS